MKMNLPNKLTVLRLCLVPVLILVGMLPEKILPFYVSCVICAVLFIGTAVTDMLDGKIARKHNLITDFGKFMDPVADKFMVIGAMFVILYKFAHLRTVMIFVLLIVVFRELAVTSMRLVVSTGEGIVVAANMLGKIKTVSQIVAISTVFLEPVVQKVFLWILTLFGVDLGWTRIDIVPLTWASLAFCVFMTLWSGINYLKAYWKFLDPQK
jgi:CDP-diacylglycerol--glycerol-3-phosphate 3-phosphatidyltransferase